MKFKVDTARGIAYKGRRGYVVDYDKIGLYIEKGFKKIYLEPHNTKVMER